MPQRHIMTRSEFGDHVTTALSESLPSLTVNSTALADIWYEVFKDTNVATALQAIKRFAQTSTKYPSPAAVREVLVEIQSERLPSDLMPRHAPDRDSFDSDAAFEQGYVRWIQAWRSQVRLGASVEEADVTALEIIGQRLDLGIERPHVLSLESLDLKRTPGSGAR